MQPPTVNSRDYPSKPPKIQSSNGASNSITKPIKESISSQGIISDKKFAKDFAKEVNRLKNILEEKKKHITEVNESKRNKKPPTVGSRKTLS